MAHSVAGGAAERLASVHGFTVHGGSQVVRVLTTGFLNSLHESEVVAGSRADVVPDHPRRPGDVPPLVVQT